jgi:hypothetical protein
MSTSWLLIIVLVAAGVLYATYRRNFRDVAKAPPLVDPATRNYSQERETARLSHLSEEDRAWESASLQRHQANQAASAPAERSP